MSFGVVEAESCAIFSWWREHGIMIRISKCYSEVKVAYAPQIDS